MVQQIFVSGSKFRTPVLTLVKQDLQKQGCCVVLPQKFGANNIFATIYVTSCLHKFIFLM